MTLLLVVGLGQGSASSAGAADEDLTEFFFALFPMEKSAECPAGGVSAQLGGHVSSSTLNAHQTARAGEPVDSDGSIVWVKLHVGETDQTHYWNRRTRETHLAGAGGCRGRLDGREE